MNDEIKFNTNEDVLFQIAMILYDRHNSGIASINDHLGEMYSYKDLEDAERYELEDERQLLQSAVKQLEQENQQLKSDLKDRIDERNRLLDEIHKVGVEIGKNDFVTQKVRNDKHD